MPDWTALSGMLGLSAALDEIQNRRVREAQLQQKLLEGKGEWEPVTERPTGWALLDQILGYSQPGQIGFGGQRYRFEPYGRMTEDEAVAAGMGVASRRERAGGPPGGWLALR